MNKGIKRFEDFTFWKKAKTLSVEIYKTFGKNKDFGFKNQIERAGVSISNNIAEGYERQTNKEFRQFLYIAKGSCGEVRSMLHIAYTLGYIEKEKYHELYSLSEEISKILHGFIKTLEE